MSIIVRYSTLLDFWKGISLVYKWIRWPHSIRFMYCLPKQMAKKFNQIFCPTYTLHFKYLFAHAWKDNPIATDVIPQSRLEGHLDAILILAMIIRLSIFPVGEGGIDWVSRRDPLKGSLVILITASKPNPVPNSNRLKKSSFKSLEILTQNWTITF